MKKRGVLIITLVVTTIFVGVSLFLLSIRNGTNKMTDGSSYEFVKAESTAHMIFSSSAFQNNGFIPAKYTCNGENVNPPLNISEVPSSAKSLAIILDDIDAPSGTWNHWSLWNINPDTKEIAENSAPTGSQEGKTSFGKIGYGGPCPPSGTHRYVFTLYALDKILSLNQGSTKDELNASLNGHIISKSDFIGLYRK